VFEAIPPPKLALVPLFPAVATDPEFILVPEFADVGVPEFADVPVVLLFVVCDVVLAVCPLVVVVVEVPILSVDDPFITVEVPVEVAVVESPFPV
jgi:hypothetical protein